MKKEKIFYWRVVSAGVNNANSGTQFFDVIITILPNFPQVKEVVLCENGVIKGLKSISSLLHIQAFNFF